MLYQLHYAVSGAHNSDITEYHCPFCTRFFPVLLKRTTIFRNPGIVEHSRVSVEPSVIPFEGMSSSYKDGHIVNKYIIMSLNVLR